MADAFIDSLSRIEWDAFTSRDRDHLDENISSRVKGSQEQFAAPFRTAVLYFIAFAILRDECLDLEQSCRTFERISHFRD